MAKYIDCEPLIKQFSGGESMKSMAESVADERFIEALKQAPAVDVAEVKHGRWQYPSYAPCGGSYVMKECSECKYRPSYSGFEYEPYYEPYTNYCPNCGADMRSATDTNVGSKKEGVDNA